MARYIKAEQGLYHSVIYTTEDGRYFRHLGGKWTWRNNNPGNLVPGSVSKKHNQIGVAGGFAVFPDYETGHEALLDCLKSTYGNRSIDQMLIHFAPPKNNPNFPIYKKDLHDQTGVKDNKKIKDFTTEQFEALWRTIEKWEGGLVSGKIVEVYKVSCTRSDKKGSITSYCVGSLDWVTKDQCLDLVKQGQIEAEICTSKSGNAYLRTSGHSFFQKHFDDLLEEKS